MAEDHESSEDKLSKLKLKLKTMGVMQDENASPEQKPKSFWKGKIPILIVILFAIGFVWWINNNELTSTEKLAKQTTDEIADTRLDEPVYPSSAYYPGNSHFTPGPPHWNPAPHYNNGNSPFADPSTAPPGNSAWPGNANRYQDRYGPPPGWRPYGGYPPPPPLPPRGFYGYPYYGPPPGYYPNSYYRGYNAPPLPPK